VRVGEIQRARLLAGALGAVEELGYSRVTVAHIAARAHVSRRTFYEVFGNREDCLLAALESIVEVLRGELADVDVQGLSWCERMRAGLWTILSFFDREPVCARALVVQASCGGAGVLERREEILAELTRMVDEGRGESARAGECPALTAQGLVGGVFAVVYARLLEGDGALPLTGVFGELMGTIVLPYLGVAAARREQARPAPILEGSRSRVTPAPVLVPSAVHGRDGGDLLAGLPMRLTYRTTLVLEAISERPGISNREVSELADISDQGQVSKLLARLQRLGLVANTTTGEGSPRSPHGKGEPNAWTLTGLGERVVLNIGAGAGAHRPERGSERGVVVGNEA
jgi:AcrR family transcriptional regulator